MSYKALIIITVCLFLFAGIRGAIISSSGPAISGVSGNDTIYVNPKPYIKLNASHNETEFYRPIYIRTLARQKNE